MVTGNHRVIVFIVSQVSSCHTHLQVTASYLDLNLALKVRLVDDRDCYCPVDIFESSYEKVVGTANCINANRSRPCEAEIPRESPETARYFETVVCKTNQNCVTTGCLAGVVLGTPPMQVARGITVDERVVPGGMVNSAPRMSCHVTHI
jgi:hypothetical protein